MAHVRPQELVDSALRASDDGMPDAANAALHGVAVKTIRRWRREYQRRGRERGQLHTASTCSRCEDSGLDAAAYAELLGWYLGDGYISRGRRDVFNLHVYNDRQYASDNLRIALLMTSVKPGGRPHTRQVPGCVVTTMSWKHWPCLFPQVGPGRKHERPIILEDWQRTIVESHPDAFLRGLFHSDGCRVNNWATRMVAGEMTPGRRSGRLECTTPGGSLRAQSACIARRRREGGPGLAVDRRQRREVRAMRTESACTPARPR
jgi:hypothetical protein